MPNRLLLACLLALPLPALAQTAAPAPEAAVEAPSGKAVKAHAKRERRKKEQAAKRSADDQAVLEAAAQAPLTGRDNIDALIAMNAKAHKIPADFIHAVIKRESNYNPRAIGRGGVYGLMQLKHGTARGVGYEGPASGLLDPKTNLAYGVAYLAGAYKTAKGDVALAYRYFNRGYYYAAKRMGVGTEVAALDEPVAPAPSAGLTGAIDRVFGRRTAQPVTATASADPAAPVVPTTAQAAIAQAPTAQAATVQTASASAAPSLRGTVAPAGETAQASIIDEASFKAIKTEAEMATVLASLSSLPLPPRRPAALRLAARKVTAIPKTALATEAKPAAAVTASQ
jgi:soluble lytic murein transglycosylase-like protein